MAISGREFPSSDEDIEKIIKNFLKIEGDNLETKIKSIEKKIESIKTKIDAMEKKIDTVIDLVSNHTVQILKTIKEKK